MESITWDNDFLPIINRWLFWGIIITDWYSEGNNPDESIKITVRFLSNEIQSNSVKVIIHNKNVLLQKAVQ